MVPDQSWQNSSSSLIARTRFVGSRGWMWTVLLYYVGLVLSTRLVADGCRLPFCHCHRTANHAGSNKPAASSVKQCSWLTGANKKVKKVHQVQKVWVSQLQDVFVMVSRWYGGIHLGGLFSMCVCVFFMDKRLLTLLLPGCASL